MNSASPFHGLTSEPCVCRVCCCCSSWPSREGGWDKNVTLLNTDLLLHAEASDEMLIFLPLLLFRASKHTHPSYECLFPIYYRSIQDAGKNAVSVKSMVECGATLFPLSGKRPGTTSVQPEQQPIVHSQSAFFQWETADEKETQKNKKQRRPPIVGSATMLLHLQLSNTKLLCTTIRNSTHQGQFHKGSVVSERGATLYSQLTRQKTPEEQQGGERRGEAVECLVSWLNTFLLEKMQPTLPARFKGWAHPKRKKSFIYSPGGFGEVMSSVSGASTAQQLNSMAAFS